MTNYILYLNNDNWLIIKSRNVADAIKQAERLTLLKVSAWEIARSIPNGMQIISAYAR